MTIKNSNINNEHTCAKLKRGYSNFKKDWKSLPEKERFTLKLLLFVAIMMTLVGITQNFVSPIHQYNIDLTIHDLDNQNTTYRVNVLMTTSEFAVDTPISAKTTIQIVKTDKKPLPDYLYLFFDGSHLYPPQKIGFGDSIYGGKIDAKKEGNFYTGKTLVYYDMDGCYDIKISTNPVPKTTQPFNVTRTCNLIHIQPSEATNLDFYNKTLVMLTSGLFVLAFIPVISLVREMLDKLPSHKEQSKEK